MFLLKKLFQLRDKTHQEEEKPFLEHLEDLRIVITRVVLTLLIAMGFCFAFRNELMEIIRRPVEQVWQVSQEEKMPSNLALDTWEAAKKAERDTANFSSGQRDYYFEHLDPGGKLKLKFHTDSVRYYRAAIDMENTDESGERFIKEFPGISDDMRSQLHALLDGEKRPDVAVDSRGKLVLMQALNPTEGFMLSIKLSLFAGIVLAFPLLLLFTLQFILPGLKKKEKRALWPAMIIGFGLFLAGVMFSYFFVLPKVLDFFYNYSQQMGVTNEWRIGYYISFATQFTLIFGLAFELPVVVMTLVKLGVLNYEIMRNTRSYAILAIVVIAALITPTPDVATLAFLAVPMILLYEICIWLSFFHKRKQREQEIREREELRQQILAAPPAFATSREEEDEEWNDDHHDDHHDHYHDDEHNDHADPYRHQDHAYDDHHDPHHDHDPHEELGDYDEPHLGDEGEEDDTGTYDFPEDELALDFTDDQASDDQASGDPDPDSPDSNKESKD
ncbi:MAG: twin-arginine translocase subunit TatC [Verrucomicrobiaceae bacterium]|jgi:sec-independent protein translocase protein TatC|nr:twin-arginine translocase subunit TatC [Verrucomicrobiaceae bacterium]